MSRAWLWERFPNILSPHCCHWVLIIPQGCMEKISHYTSHYNILYIWRIYSVLFRFYFLSGTVHLFFILSSKLTISKPLSIFVVFRILANFSSFPIEHSSCDTVEEGRITACTFRWHPRKFCFSDNTCILLISLILVLCCNFKISFQSCCQPSYSQV